MSERGRVKAGSCTGANSGNRGEESGGRGVVAERAADVGEEIYVAGSEDEAAAELEGIFSQRMLAVAGGAGALAGGRVVTAEKMQQISGAEAGGAVGFAIFVDEERKGDAGFLAEEPGIAEVAETDGGEARALRAQRGFIFTQPGDVLAAEDSTVVAQEDDDGRRVGPESAQTNGAFVAIGDGDVREVRAEGAIHRQELWRRAPGRSSQRKT